MDVERADLSAASQTGDGVDDDGAVVMLARSPQGRPRPPSIGSTAPVRRGR
jgi:hypothetical protein